MGVLDKLRKNRDDDEETGEDQTELTSEILDIGNKMGLNLANPTLRKIFLLGYEVGYFHHNEYVDWIINLKGSLYTKCINLGLENDFEKYYEAGKKIGTDKDDRVILSIGKSVDNGSAEEPKIDFELRKESPPMLRHPDQLERPGSTLKPTMIVKPDQTRIPSVIQPGRRPKLKKK